MQQTVVLSIEDLSGARFSSFENAVVINAGQTMEREFEIAVSPPASLQAGVNHFQLVSRVGNEREPTDQTFIMPSKNSP